MSLSPVSRLWWLWLPIVMMVIQIIIELTCSPEIKEFLLAEGGAHENLQAFFMVVGCGLAIPLFRYANGIWMKLWVGLMVLGSLYVAGEELSWGQWIFYWTTPVEWAQINDQNETNLHNVSDWLDQKPLIILQFGVLVGGLIIPALLKWKPSVLPPRFAQIYATLIIVPTAIICFILKTIDTANDNLDMLRFFWRINEVYELYLYYFIFLYIIILRDRLKSQAQPSAA